MYRTSTGKNYSKTFLNQEGDQFFRTFNNTKTSILERFNGTLKMKMCKFFMLYHIYRYTDVLKQFLYSFNDTYLSSIKSSD